MKINEILKITFPVITPRLSSKSEKERNKDWGMINRNRAKNTPSFLEILESVQGKKS